MHRLVWTSRVATDCLWSDSLWLQPPRVDSKDLQLVYVFGLKLAVRYAMLVQTQSDAVEVVTAQCHVVKVTGCLVILDRLGDGSIGAASVNDRQSILRTVGPAQSGQGCLS